jgi:putative transferase (TIGR04331 family)
MRRLFLSAVSDDFNPSEDIALGPWCFLGKERLFCGWEELPFSDAFQTVEDLGNAAALSTKWANSLIPGLAKKLNQTQGLDFPDSFWRMLLMPWLNVLVQSTYDRYGRLTTAIEKYGEERLEIATVSISAQFWKFQDSLKFVNPGILGEEYNHWIFSHLLKLHLPKNWTIRESPAALPSAQLAIGGASLQDHRPFWEKALLKIYKKSFKNLRCAGVYGVSPLTALLLSIYLTFLPSSKKKNLTLVEEKLQQFLPEEPNLSRLLGLEELVEQTIPQFFLEIRKHLPKRKFFRKGKLRIRGPVIYYNDKLKLELALAAQHGEKLIFTQHGGNYGNAKVYPIASEIEYVYDFFSWGWKDQENYLGKIHPLPSPLCQKYTNRHSASNDSLILVGTVMDLLPVSLTSIPRAHQQLNYRRDKKDFIQTLASPVFQRLSYRAYFGGGTGCLEDRSYFEEEFPGLKICEGDLHSQILKCKLLVVDHPGTTLNLALAANIPMIGYWNSEDWPMCEQSLPYFLALEKVGILFSDAEEAAKKVNQIWGDAQEWWNQPEVQEARLAWCEQYAKVDRFWWWQWMKALREI